MRYMNVHRQKQVNSSPSASIRNVSLTRKCCFRLWVMCRCAVAKASGCHFNRKFPTAAAADMNLCASHRRLWHANKPKMSLAKKWNAKKWKNTERKRSKSLAAERMLGTAKHESWVLTFHPCHNNYTLFFFWFFLSLCVFRFNFPHRKWLRNLFHFGCRIQTSSTPTQSQSQQECARRRERAHTQETKRNISPNFWPPFPPLFVFWLAFYFHALRYSNVGWW